MTAQFIAWPVVVDRSNNTGIHQLEGLRNTRGDNSSPDHWLSIAAQLLRTERSDRSQIRWHYLTNLSSCTQSFNANNPVHKYISREGNTTIGIFGNTSWFTSFRSFFSKQVLHQRCLCSSFNSVYLFNELLKTGFQRLPGLLLFMASDRFTGGTSFPLFIPWHHMNL